MSTIYPEYNQSNHAYSNISLSEFNNIATKNISAYATSNIRNNMTLGASSNVILEAYNQMNMICSSNAGYKVYNSSNEILKIQPSMIQSSNVKLVVSGGDNKSTTCVSQTTLLTSNNNQQISTVNSNFLVSTSIKLTSNFEVAGNTYSTSLNMYKNITPAASNSNLSQVAYSFYINDSDQLQLVRSSKYGTSNVSTTSQTVNLFGTLASSNDLYYNSAIYYTGVNLYNNVPIVKISSNTFMNQRTIDGFTGTCATTLFGHYILYVPVNNKIYGWGYNNERTIATTGDTVLSPIAITHSNLAPFANYIQGGRQCFGITANGKLYGWTGSPQPSLAVSTSNLTIATMSFMYQFLVVTTEGKAYSWGGNYTGEAGIGISSSSNNYIANPTLVSLSNNPSFVACAINRGNLYSNNTVIGQGYNSMLLTNTGNLYMAGNNYYNQISSTSNFTNFNVFTLVSIPTNPVIKAIACGAACAAAISSTGQLYMWGNNSSGQCGTGNTNTVTAPTLVPFSNNPKIVSISVNTHSLAISSTGQLYCWGNNSFGQLGFSNYNNGYYRPTAYSNIPGNPAITNAYVSTGSSLIKTELGSIYGIGQNNSGQLGQGYVSYGINYPVLISFP